MPIAVKYGDQPVSLQPYKANIAEGSGKYLPAILGSDSMRGKEAVLILKKGKEMIVFPGKGGHKIQWSPGTKLLPMIDAPSGHLVIPCDHFDQLTTATSDEFTFCTDHTEVSSDLLYYEIWAPRAALLG